MASTAPTLTWQQGTNQAPATATDPQSVLDALAAAVAASTTWQVVSSAAGYLEIGPVGGAISACRVLVAFGVDVAQIVSPHNLVAGVLYMGIAPDGGTLGAPLGSGAPYGVARWSGYWKCSGDIDGGGDVNNVYCLTSAEIFSCWFNEAATDDWWGGVAGAIIDPPTDSDGEGTPGRVYGMMTSGTDVISVNFWTGVSDFCNSGIGNLDPQIGVFRPAVPATFIKLDRGDNSAGLASPRSETEGGTRITMPQLYYGVGPAPINAVGILRQMRKAQDGRMRRIVQDSGANDLSFQVSGASSTDGDALSFDNG